MGRLLDLLKHRESPSSSGASGAFGAPREADLSQHRVRQYLQEQLRSLPQPDARGAPVLQYHTQPGQPPFDGQSLPHQQPAAPLPQQDASAAPVEAESEQRHFMLSFGLGVASGVVCGWAALILIVATLSSVQPRTTVAAMSFGDDGPGNGAYAPTARYVAPAMAMATFTAHTSAEPAAEKSAPQRLQPSSANLAPALSDASLLTRVSVAVEEPPAADGPQPTVRLTPPQAAPNLQVGDDLAVRRLAFMSGVFSAAQPTVGEAASFTPPEQQSEQKSTGRQTVRPQVPDFAAETVDLPPKRPLLPEASLQPAPSKPVQTPKRRAQPTTRRKSLQRNRSKASSSKRKRQRRAASKRRSRSSGSASSAAKPAIAKPKIAPKSTSVNLWASTRPYWALRAFQHDAPSAN